MDHESAAQQVEARFYPPFNHAVISNGRIVGTWKRTLGPDALGVEAKLFSSVTRAEIRSLELASKRLAEFLGASVVNFTMAS